MLGVPLGGPAGGLAGGPLGVPLSGPLGGSLCGPSVLQVPFYFTINLVPALFPFRYHIMLG